MNRRPYWKAEYGSQSSSFLCCSLTETACCSPCLLWPVWSSYRSSCYATFSLVSTSLSSSTTTPGSSVSCCSSPSLMDTWLACACASAQSEIMREADLYRQFGAIQAQLALFSPYSGRFCPTRQKQQEPSWPSSCPWVWPWEQVCRSSSEHWCEQEASPSGLPSLAWQLCAGWTSNQLWLTWLPLWGWNDSCVNKNIYENVVFQVNQFLC